MIGCTDGMILAIFDNKEYVNICLSDFRFVLMLCPYLQDQICPLR